MTLSSSQLAKGCSHLWDALGQPDRTHRDSVSARSVNPDGKKLLLVQGNSPEGRTVSQKVTQIATSERSSFFFKVQITDLSFGSKKNNFRFSFSGKTRLSALFFSLACFMLSFSFPCTPHRFSFLDKICPGFPFLF